jgi:gamma-D-glutamyl-L-lysine dipeptidyl-peptidase
MNASFCRIIFPWILYLQPKDFSLKKSTVCLLLPLSFICACSSSRKMAVQLPDPSLQAAVDTIRQQFAPDKKTVLFDVSVHERVVTGETSLPAAKDALIRLLNNDHLQYTDSIRVLPDSSLHGSLTAVVSLSVVNLRAKPGHVNEMVTQATMGMPVNILKREKGWYLVQTPDNYIAWTEGGGIKPMNKPQLDAWRQVEKVIYTKPFGFAYSTSSTNSQTVSDLVYGDVAELQHEQDGFYQIRFPDGRISFVPSGEMMLYRDWVASRNPARDSLVSSSMRLMGVPYLWGGTSFKGVDCSGFTRTVYFMNGLLLPRDASQQVKIGVEVDTKNGWSNLQAGDLLFFGTPARDGKPEHISHVGMWLGGPNNEFIQSSSRVQISSFNPGAANYDGGGQHRFIRAKRIAPGDALFDLRHASFY